MMANLKFIWILIFFSIAFISLIIYKLNNLKSVISALVNINHEKRFLLNFSLTKKKIGAILLSLAFIALSCAILRPQANEKEEKILKPERDLLIALDISRSMLAQDVKPNRLEFAKEKIKKLVIQLKSNRIGLMLYSSDAYLFVPFTADIEAFIKFLDDVTIEQFTSGTTAIDKALARAIEIFTHQKAKKNKLLVIFTDGEDFSTNLSGSVNEAKKIGLNSFIIGVGTQTGAPIPLIDDKGDITGYQKDKSNNIVISKLNEQLLSQLAISMDARFIQAQADSDSDILELSKTINNIERESNGEGKITIAQELYYIPAAVALAFLSIEWIL